MQTILLTIALLAGNLQSADPWLTFEGAPNLPGNGKHIVLVSGEPEYRSEETMPMLGKLLATRHGFKTTVLFAINPETGLIDPTCRTNIPGLAAVDTADLLILNIRFRELPPQQNKHLTDYFNSGKPLIGIRTATHGFRGELQYVGSQVFGPWGGHHGHHKFEGTRGIIVESQKTHPVNIGVKDVFGKTDVYASDIKKLEQLKATPLILGQVTQTLEPDSKPVVGGEDKKGNKKNDPMRPVVWWRTHTWPNGKQSRVLTTTMGASVDFVHEGLRRILVNASYWQLGMTKQITPELDCSIVGQFRPTMYKTIPKSEMWTDLKLTPQSFR